MVNYKESRKFVHNVQFYIICQVHVPGPPATIALMLLVLIFVYTSKCILVFVFVFAGVKLYFHLCTVNMLHMFCNF